MKNIFIIAALLNLLSVKAQDGIVYYKCIDAIGIGNQNGEEYNAYTIFSKSNSFYVVAKDSLEKAQNKINEAKFFKNSDGSKNSISNGLVLTPQGQQVVSDYTKKIMLSNVFDGKHTYVKEVLPKFNWKITKQKKKIGKFNCVLGETIFRGRKYFAWYTPDIPVYSGPWKLNGLPGMILEAYDEGKYISWTFQKYQFPVKIAQNYTIRKGKKEKDVKFLTIDQFKIYCKNEIQRGYEKLLIMAKEYPGLQPTKEPISSYYLESFD
jgi:GLPGLI family protein